MIICLCKSMIRYIPALLSLSSSIHKKRIIRCDLNLRGNLFKLPCRNSLEDENVVPLEHFNLKSSGLQLLIRLLAGGKVGSFACFGVAMECAASKCANARWPLLCPAALCITLVLVQWPVFETATCRT